MKLYRIHALMLKYWYVGLRRLDRFLDVFYWPLIGMLVWGFTTYYISDLVKDSFIVSILLGGAILWTFFNRAQNDIGVFLLEDFWSRNMINLFSSPMKSSELIVSIALFGLLRAAVSFVFLALIAYALYSFNFLSIGLAYVTIFAFGLMLFGWIIGILVTGLILRFGGRIQVFAWTIGWLIEPFSAVYYPLSSLPDWLQKISLLLPTTYLFEGMRAAFQNAVIDWKSLVLSFAMNIIFLIPAYIFFEKSVLAAKRKGMLTKYYE